MKDNFKLPYPKPKIGELEKYNQKLLQDDEDPAYPKTAMPPYRNGDAKKKEQAAAVRQTFDGSDAEIAKRMAEQESQEDLGELRTIGTEVSGGLFDRVRFLKERMDETSTFISERVKMNEVFNQDIEASIGDLERLLTSASDKDETRQTRATLNLLKMERRKENNQFWRDLVALRNQLRELSEQHEVESKIAELFKDVNFGPN